MEINGLKTHYKHRHWGICQLSTEQKFCIQPNFCTVHHWKTPNACDYKSKYMHAKLAAIVPGNNSLAIRMSCIQHSYQLK